MSYKNSVKIVSSNFIWVWKQLAYSCVCLGIVAFLTWLIALPTANLLTNSGWINDVKSVFSAVYTTPSSIVLETKQLIANLYNILATNFAGYWFSYIGMFICAILLPMFLAGIGRFAICKVATSKITSQVSISFVSSLFGNFSEAVKYSLYKTLIDLACLVLDGVALIVYLICANSLFTALIFFFIFLLIVVFFESFKLTIMSNFAPLIIEENKPVHKAFKASFKKGFSNFLRTLSNSIITILSVLFVNVFLGVFTVGVGLLITLPLSTVFIGVFMVTNYYTMEGKRYYLNENLIVEPVKVETKNY